MKEFINKLIGRLEEIYNRNDKQKKEAYEEQDWEYFDLFTHRNEGVYTSISIVNELAEEYKDKLDDEWQIIYNKILNLEKKYANYGNIESVNDCIKLENLLQYFKEELQGKEEYINTSSDASSGWIPCSERLPEKEVDVLVCFSNDMDCVIAYRTKMMNTNLKDVWVNSSTAQIISSNIIAWQPLPAPYKEGE